MTVKIFGILFIIVIISALVALFIIAKRIAKRNNISVWKALNSRVSDNVVSGYNNDYSHDLVSSMKYSHLPCNIHNDD